ncbi:hypothetical protein HMN09_00655000 [Mycena chlorophos]|uniref:Uncharacterized protein n=1 Tax=Mycena chlorophos TaxID=658473 RepID=A0A8H6T4Y0_MYCCL|nr:hypothetical protein HMN09_00655000 [Mycena chlorophos]
MAVKTGKRNAMPTLTLPTKRGIDDLDSDDEPKLATAAESGVLAASLLRSRENWLKSIFRLFSSENQAAPVHTATSCGVCSISIGGLHVFPETTFYEVRYSATPPAPPSPAPAWPYGSLAQNPGIIQAMNTAAAANPIFANMLANAAAGTASTIELQTLSFLVQSLPGHAAPVASTPIQATSTNFQLVLQYSESPSERWLIPRGPAIYEKATAGDDFTLTFAIPLQGGSAAQDDFTAVPTLGTSAAQVVTMDFKKPPTTLSDTISRWIVGTERENRMRLTKLKEQSKRNYLVYRVAPKDVIANLQGVSGTDYTMTSIKPGSRPVAPPSPPKPKRKPGRKPKADTQSISAPAPTAVYSPPSGRWAVDLGLDHHHKEAKVSNGVAALRGVQENRSCSCTGWS